jgi:hypothetical protein
MMGVQLILQECSNIWSPRSFRRGAYLDTRDWLLRLRQGTARNELMLPLGGRFVFEARQPARHCAITAEDIRRCRKIEAVLLAPPLRSDVTTFHPIITPQLISRLNSALAVQWTDVPTRFSTATIASMDGADFTFAGVAA